MITAFLDRLGLPKSCELDRTIFKRMFLENASLNVTDKKALKEDIEKIKWTHALKPSTINIAPYIDQTCEYFEIVILSVAIIKPQRVNRIATFIHKAIPYPTVLVFGHTDQVAVGVADKRINLANKSKLVVANSWLTPWFDPQSADGPSQAFVADFNCSNLPFSTFHAFYGALRDRIIALVVADRTGRYKLATSNVTETRIENLNQIDKLSLEVGKLKTKLRKTKQMAQQITLNTEIKKLKDAILKLESEMQV
ncbi:MAG: DUF4391 domain-containing protein [Aestuariivita sp.]|nr:DUF4391 domain-containing protein [Aestuariivita sp.]MCY4202261.1 DUF4391 domain-containing protein [Aestuariivita sp.]